MADVGKSFKDYINANHREYHVRIKTVSPLDDDAMGYIERVLQKYVPIDITAPVKTIMQKHPLDFTDIRNAEVWIVDVVTELPASAYVLQQELKLALALPEKYIVVRAANDPLEVETQRMNANDEIDMEAMEQGLSPASRLSINDSYDDDELGELEHPAYGDEYNKRFLEVLAQVAEERIAHDASPKSEELNTGGTVSDDGVQDNSFNDGYDEPQPVSNKYSDTLKNIRKAAKAGDPRLSTKGNYDDDEVKRTKKYDKYGKTEKVATVTIKNERKGIRNKK